MSSVVLDASAVLALLNEEAGKERVEAALPAAVIGAVNYCEVLGKLIDAGMPEVEARESVDLLGIEVVEFDSQSAQMAAALRASTRKQGLSLGDRCCLALGLARDLPVMTAERAWANLKIGARIVLIR